MHIKSRLTQEIANAYPDWAKVRTDDQSVGKSYLNVIANRIEELELEIFRNYKNQFLTTAFVGEVDQLYKVDLPTDFNFTVDSVNNLSPVNTSPTLSGYITTGWLTVTEAQSGSIKDLWYDALPTRLTEVAIYSGVNNLLASGLSSDINLTQTTSGLKLDNPILITVDSDLSLVSVDKNNQIQRSKVKITGTTWKNTQESEEVIFLYPDSKQSIKSYISIDSITPSNFVNDSIINVYTHRFNQSVYMDSFETISQFQESRENLPYFWALANTNAGYSALELQRYASEKAIELLSIKPSYVTYRRWELLGSTNLELSLKDIALVPFQKRIYGIDNKTLYIFDTNEELPDLMQLTSKTSNSLVTIDTSVDYCSRYDEIEVSLLFQRPIKTISRHRLKIQYPDGLEFGVLSDGTLVPTTTDYFVYGEVSDRFIRPSIFIELDDIGQYNLTLECVYLDDTIDIAQRAVLVSVKKPIATLDLSTITTQAAGIDVDYLNRLLILDTNNDIHHVQLHYDLALVDYQKKSVLFRENYSQVKITP